MGKSIYVFLSSVLTLILVILSGCNPSGEMYTPKTEAITVTDRAKQEQHLERLLRWLPPDRTSLGRVSFLDETFQDWLKRTGEIPPDFDQMPSIPFLPDPLVLDEGRENIPVKTKAQWEQKREWMRKNLQYYISGTIPPKPDNLQSTVLKEVKDGEVTLRYVELKFGPQHKANLNLELMIPPGEGPFPVFLTQWNHREWAQVAVRRGYIGCLYTGADTRDDTEKYSEIWAGEYDFTRLMRRAYGASRAIDYLYTLPQVDKNKIGITGHSRNGKQSLMAAAFDERITACIPSSGGSGAEVPWRYTSDNYDIEDISLLACAQPSWLHPRLRFFVGHEHKLPVDQNLFMALIAPRGLMLSTAISEGASNPWGIEQAYLATRKVYEFLGAENNIAIHSRYGLHSISAREMEYYLDFFDYVFKRSDHQPQNHLFYNYSFEKWKSLSRENINPKDYPAKGIDDIETTSDGAKIASAGDWEKKKGDVAGKIRWLLGDEPPGVTNPGPGSLSLGGRGEAGVGSYLIRPQATKTMGVMAVSPYNGFGDQLFGYLYYPKGEDGNPISNNLPLVIYLHEYDYSKGFNSYHQIESLLHSMIDRGFSVFCYDMLGLGNRIEEATRFYERYPHWSKLGKMVEDAKGAVEAMANMDFIDSSRIYVAGYSLGATVGLFTAALDERIAGIVSVAGFTPMRLNTLDRGTEGIKSFSHLHGLLPRLGFFVGQEAHIPVDFHEVLASIAPRPLLVVAPIFDKDAHLEDVRNCVDEARKIYGLYGATENLSFFSPDEYNRLSPDVRQRTFDWLEEQIKDIE